MEYPQHWRDGAGECVTACARTPQETDYCAVLVAKRRAGVARFAEGLRGLAGTYQDLAANFEAAAFDDHLFGMIRREHGAVRGIVHTIELVNRVSGLGQVTRSHRRQATCDRLARVEVSGRAIDVDVTVGMTQERAPAVARPANRTIGCRTARVRKGPYRLLLTGAGAKQHVLTCQQQRSSIVERKSKATERAGYATRIRDARTDA